MNPRGGEDLNATVHGHTSPLVIYAALRWIGVGAAIASISLLAGFGVLLLATPNVDALAVVDPRATAVVDRAAASGLKVEWSPVPLELIATDLKLAVLVSEDLRFFDHNGFDRHEIRAALREALAGKRLRGASTITQQLARNIWLSRDRTVLRKLKEGALTWKLERALGKRRIFELYLNSAVFGSQTVGVEAAARRYFGVSAAEVSRQQAAELAATLPAPTRWYPGSGSPRAGRQVQRILQRMDWPTGLRTVVEEL